MQLQATQNTQTNDFVANLVRASLGYDIEELPNQERPEIIAKCINIFKDFILNYVGTKYGQKDMLRLKAMYQGDSAFSFDKNPDLSDKFDEAYDAFLDNLETTWKK